MKELEKILNLDAEINQRKLSTSEKKIIRYLLKLKKPIINIASLAREISMSRVTADANYEKLYKAGIIRQVWELNPFLLGYKIVSADVNFPRSKEKSILSFLEYHTAVRSIYRLYQGRFLIEFIVQEVGDFNTIQQKLKDMGVEFIDSKIAIEKIYDSIE